MSGTRDEPTPFLFDPITLRLLGEVFDRALQNAADVPALGGLRGPSLRQVLASRIIAQARRGERDAERLKAAALADFGPLAAPPGQRPRAEALPS